MEIGILHTSGYFYFTTKMFVVLDICISYSKANYFEFKNIQVLLLVSSRSIRMII